jgi:hypothetical protein
VYGGTHSMKRAPCCQSEDIGAYATLHVHRIATGGCTHTQLSAWLPKCATQCFRVMSHCTIPVHLHYGGRDASIVCVRAPVRQRLRVCCMQRYRQPGTRHRRAAQNSRHGDATKWARIERRQMCIKKRIKVGQQAVTPTDVDANERHFVVD